MVVHNRVGVTIEFDLRLIYRHLVLVAEDRCELFEGLMSGCRSQRMDLSANVITVAKHDEHAEAFRESHLLSGK